METQGGIVFHNYIEPSAPKTSVHAALDVENYHTVYDKLFLYT